MLSDKIVILTKDEYQDTLDATYIKGRKDARYDTLGFRPNTTLENIRAEISSILEDTERYDNDKLRDVLKQVEYAFAAGKLEGVTQGKL